MAEPWTYAGEVPMLGTAGTITLVEGSAFAISGRAGDMAPTLPHGFFFRDTRFLSRLELRVNSQVPEALEAEALDPFSATFALRTRPRAGRADSPLLIFRHRYVGRGMREDIVIRNYGDEPTFCSLELLRILCWAQMRPQWASGVRLPSCQVTRVTSSTSGSRNHQRRRPCRPPPCRTCC